MSLVGEHADCVGDLSPADTWAAWSCVNLDGASAAAEAEHAALPLALSPSPEEDGHHLVTRPGTPPVCARPTTPLRREPSAERLKTIVSPEPAVLTTLAGRQQCVVLLTQAAGTLRALRRDVCRGFVPATEFVTLALATASGCPPWDDAAFGDRDLAPLMLPYDAMRALRTHSATIHRRGAWLFWACVSLAQLWGKPEGSPGSGSPGADPAIILVQGEAATDEAVGAALRAVSAALIALREGWKRIARDPRRTAAAWAALGGDAHTHFSAATDALAAACRRMSLLCVQLQEAMDAAAAVLNAPTPPPPTMPAPPPRAPPRGAHGRPMMRKMEGMRLSGE